MRARVRHPAGGPSPRRAARESGTTLGALSLLLLPACAPSSSESGASPSGPETPATAGERADTPGPGSRQATERLEALRAIGYVDFSPEAIEANDASGVVRWERERTSPGLNLYCSRTSQEAFLMDASGAVVHRWTRPDPMQGIWSHGLLGEDGSLLVLVKFRHLLMLDRDSRRLWKRRLEAHHDVSPGPGGTYVALVRELREHRGLRVAFPAVVWLDRRGLETDRWSAAEHLSALRRALDDRDFLDTVLDELEAAGQPAEIDLEGARAYDYFHANTVSLLPENALGAEDARFRAGNVLLCFRNVDQVLILDAERRDVVWSFGAGELEWPHHPTLLPSGRLLVFDNGVRTGRSRVVELDPPTGEIVWQYVADPPESFFSRTKGSAQRLANGNTLVCEGDAGRAFEVTREGEIVWEWRNPALNEEGHRQALYRMSRVPTEDLRALRDTPPR